MRHLDHIVLAAPTLGAGVTHFETLTGVRASLGGHHPEGGTENALASLGETTYLEILAPLPGTQVRSSWVEFCRASVTPRILTFAMRAPLPLAEIARKEVAAGRPPTGPYDYGRRRADGMLLAWKLLDLDPAPFGRALPFFIDWLDSEHPSLTATPGARLASFEIGHPDPRGLSNRLRELGADVPVHAAPELRFLAMLDCPKGKVGLT